jgi:hypothetical protein
LIDTGFQSVDDDTPGSTTQKHQGAFEAIDDAGQILPESWDHAADPAVADTGQAGTSPFIRALQPDSPASEKKAASAAVQSWW